MKGDCLTIREANPTFWVFDGQKWVDGLKAMNQTFCAQVQG